MSGKGSERVKIMPDEALFPSTSGWADVWLDAAGAEPKQVPEAEKPK